MKKKAVVITPISPEILHAFNTMDATMSFLGPETRVATWTALEEYAIRKRFVKKTEIVKAPGAKTNGPGLRFKSWLADFILTRKTSEKKRLARVKRAEKIIAALQKVLDLAWERFAGTIKEAK